MVWYPAIAKPALIVPIVPLASRDFTRALIMTCSQLAPKLVLSFSTLSGAVWLRYSMKSAGTRAVLGSKPSSLLLTTHPSFSAILLTIYSSKGVSVWSLSLFLTILNLLHINISVYGMVNNSFSILFEFSNYIFMLLD